MLSYCANPIVNASFRGVMEMYAVNIFPFLSFSSPFLSFFFPFLSFSVLFFPFMSFPFLSLLFSSFPALYFTVLLCFLLALRHRRFSKCKSMTAPACSHARERKLQRLYLKLPPELIATFIQSRSDFDKCE